MEELVDALLYRLFPDNSPYLWPPSFNPPAEFLDAGRAALDAGQVDMYGYGPGRLARVCAQAGVAGGEGQSPLGCAVPLEDGRWAVFYNARLPPTLRQAVIDHELAHAGSWNGDHDGS